MWFLELTKYSEALCYMAITLRAPVLIHFQMESFTNADFPLPPAEGWSGGASPVLSALPGRELYRSDSRLI